MVASAVLTQIKWCEILEGVIYLHSHQPIVIHGDLKLVMTLISLPKICSDDILQTNILIDDQEHARICDFGLARILSEIKTDLTTTTNYTGSLRYMAYELARTDEPFTVPTASSDMYAMGCLGLEVLTILFLRLSAYVY
jgi:serine/threonine protein kinase